MSTLVSNFSELKSVVEDSSTTEIIATSNITFLSGGIKINLSKPNIVIDFGGFTVTDNLSSSFTDTIYISSTTNVISVTVKNAVWSGRNYYGIIGVYDGNTNSTINLENITYTGPQPIYNKNGKTQITNCNFSVSKNGSSTNPQEFAEANRISIFGNVKVVSETTSNAVIWFTNANSELLVNENAVFSVEALSTYFLYTDSIPNLNFKSYSQTSITTKNGLFYTTGTSSHIASSFILEAGASFTATENQKNSVPMLKIQKTLQLESDSTFKLFSPSSGSSALIYFANVATINFNNPKNVVLYNNGGSIFSFQTGSTSSPNKLELNGEMFNLWQTAKFPLESAGGFDDEPTSSYHKNNYAENLTISITLSNSSILSLTSNLESGDTGYPMTAQNINLLSSKVLSLGALPLVVNEITDISKSITGSTFQNSNVKAIFNETTLSGISSNLGDFEMTLPALLAKNITVNILANSNFLTKTIKLITTGSVSVTSVLPLEFFAFAVPANRETIPRINADWEVEITDTRDSGDDFYVYASIQKPLSSGSNELENSLVFVQNDETKIISSSPTLIYTGKHQTPPNITKLKWNKENGFLLKIDAKEKYPAGVYTATLNWEVSTSPKS